MHVLRRCVVEGYTVCVYVLWKEHDKFKDSALSQMHVHTHTHTHTHTQVIDKDLRYPVSLAVDCKGSNVYFSDTRNTEGQGRIEVTSYNGRQRKVLLHNLRSPGSLALNMLTG